MIKQIKTQRGSTARIQRLREISEQKKIPSISMERGILITEAYQKYEGTCSTPVLRGKVFKYLMENRQLYLEKGALIVGERGHEPQAAPTFPEISCHSLADLTSMKTRKKISYHVTEEDCKIQAELILPYWEKRNMATKIARALPQKWHDYLDSGLFTEFLTQRGPGHGVADGKIYRRGYQAAITEIEQVMARLDFENDFEAAQKKEELLGMKLVCEGMIIMGQRYAALARELAAEEKDLEWKQELLMLAEVCEEVPANRPKTFRQAIQMYWFTHIGVGLEMNHWDSYSPGKLDQHLTPFYEKEIAEGTLTRNEAREYLENLWIQFNNQPAPPKTNLGMNERITYTDFCNITSGGLKADGSTGVSEVSYLILEVMDELRLLQPSSNVQIARNTPEDFLKAALKISRKGWGQPAYYNAEGTYRSLIEMGKDPLDALENSAIIGCVEIAAAGQEASVLAGYLNIPKVLELVLNEGYDAYTQKQVGPKTGNPTNFDSYEAFYDAFEKQLDAVVTVKFQGNETIEALYRKHLPLPLLSVLTDDCIQAGRDYMKGGARYNTSLFQCVGMGTMADSLAVIKKQVFEEKRISMAHLLKACQQNFNGMHEILALISEETPKFGNDIDYVDDLFREVGESLDDIINGRQMKRGARTLVEYSPAIAHMHFGQVMAASPNGRRSVYPLSEGISPEKGSDRLGPTAVIRSAAKLNQQNTGGVLLNQKFSPQVMVGEDGLLRMGALLRAYFSMGGQHMQFNVIENQTLRKAQKNPAAYEHLIVRVAGYSDYFNHLDKAMQDDIIFRTEQTANQW
ncbi:trans-4-hydroxy-L-proline dehydratase [Enterococcus sp. LJL98]